MDETLIALRKILASHPYIHFAMLFGSVALGSARPDSDIDIAVLGQVPLTTQQKIGLIEEIALTIGRPVDLIDLKTAGEPLIGEILKGKRIIGSNDDFAGLLTRHLLDVADFVPLQQRILRERREQWIS
jgi:predicted nucleotidyltransferase